MTQISATKTNQGLHPNHTNLEVVENQHLEQTVQTTIEDLSMNLISFNIVTFEYKIMRYNEIIQTIDDAYSLKDYLVFTRIDTSDVLNIKKCSFCSKSASYNDIELKNYCWFHRSQHE
jgi:hypothetical protein